MKGVTHSDIHQGTVSTPCASWIDFVWFPEFLVRFRRRTGKSISRRFKLAKNIKTYLNMSCKTHGMGHCQWSFLPWYLIAPLAASLAPTSSANQDPRAQQTNLITFSWFKYLGMDLCLINGPVWIMKRKYGFLAVAINEMFSTRNEIPWRNFSALARPVMSWTQGRPCRSAQLTLCWTMQSWLKHFIHHEKI